MLQSAAGEPTSTGSSSTARWVTLNGYDLGGFFEPEYYLAD